MCVFCTSHFQLQQPFLPTHNPSPPSPLPSSAAVVVLRLHRRQRHHRACQYSHVCTADAAGLRQEVRRAQLRVCFNSPPPHRLLTRSPHPPTSYFGSAGLCRAALPETTICKCSNVSDLSTNSFSDYVRTTAVSAKFFFFFLFPSNSTTPQPPTLRRHATRRVLTIRRSLVVALGHMPLTTRALWSKTFGSQSRFACRLSNKTKKNTNSLTPARTPPPSSSSSSQHRAWRRSRQLS